MKENLIYEKLNQAWKQTTNVVLGGEVGELKDFEEWLREGISLANSPQTPLWKEVIDKDTGMKMAVFGNLTRKPIKFVRWKDFSSVKIEPLSINEIKDIDSILDAWRGKWYYLAEMVLGESSHVEKSDGIFNSHFVLCSYGVADSKYVAYGLWVRNGSSYVFGGGGGPSFKFAIRSFYGGNLIRTLETYFSADTNDVYYSFRILGSAEIMFSFNVIGKRYMIGNLQLSKTKYYSVKTALLEQIRDELSKRKKLPSLFQLITESPYIPTVEEVKNTKIEQPKFDISPIEEGFRKTTKILLGEELELKDLETYLSRGRAFKVEEVKSLLGNPVKFYHLMFYAHFPELKNRLLSFKELENAKLPNLSEEEIQSFGKIKEAIGKIAVICQEVEFKGSFGANINYYEVPVAVGAIHAYKTFDVTSGKHQAFNYLSCPNSQYVYGSFFIVNSRAVINSDIGDYLMRAHGCYQCNHSSDIHFSIYIDGSKEVMFSQHLKGARYVIGNLQLSPEVYKEIKTSLIEQILDELKNKKKLHFDGAELGV